MLLVSQSLSDDGYVSDPESRDASLPASAAMAVVEFEITEAAAKPSNRTLALATDRPPICRFRLRSERRPTFNSFGRTIPARSHLRYPSGEPA